MKYHARVEEGVGHVRFTFAPRLPHTSGHVVLDTTLRHAPDGLMPESSGLKSSTRGSIDRAGRTSGTGDRSTRRRSDTIGIGGPQ